MASQIKEDEKKGHARTIVVIVIMLALLLILSIIIIVRLLSGQPKEDAETGSGSRGIVVGQDNAEELAMNEGTVPDGHYDVSMSIDWHFKGDVTEDAKVANKTTNTRTVYFDLLTEGEEDLVYSSPYIPVGESMQGLPLRWYSQQYQEHR